MERVINPYLCFLVIGPLCLLDRSRACDLTVTSVDGGAATVISLNDGVQLRTTANSVTEARCVAVPESQIVLILWNERDSIGEVTPWYAISLDGLSAHRVTPTSYSLKLRNFEFDPLLSSPGIPEGLECDADCRLHTVQFFTQSLENFQQTVEELGARIQAHLHDHAMIVEMDANVRAAVEQLPIVRWVGLYHPAYRLASALRYQQDQDGQTLPTQRYIIQLFRSTSEQRAMLVDNIIEIGGEVDNMPANASYVEATLSPEQLMAAAGWNEVAFISLWGEPVIGIDKVRRVSGSAYIEGVAGYSGAGVRGAVIDTGVFESHPDFTPPPIAQTDPIGGVECHGTNVYGLIFGDGSNSNMARGLLPAGEGIFGNLYAVGTQGRYLYTCLSVIEASPEICESACQVENPSSDPNCPYRALFQTNSWWPNPQGTEYTPLSHEQDRAVFDFDLFVCQSQGNTGNRHSAQESWAKNIMSVGGINHLDTECRDDDAWDPDLGDTIPGASYGPAEDGRIKPDLVHFYDSVYTTHHPNQHPCAPYCQPCVGSYYRSDFGGTSAAAPIVCGHAGLFFEMWGKPKAPGSLVNIFGRTLPNPTGDVFDNRCHAATAKAMLINTAKQYDFVNGINRFNSGWGSPDVRKIYELRDRFPVIIDESVVLSVFGSYTTYVTVPAGTPALKVTMVYTDPPGNPSASIALVNDLTLRVVSPSGHVYMGNWDLYNDHWSDACTIQAPCLIDNRNNVENVFVQNPQPGAWEVRVSADEINMDGHPETPQMDADFALVVSLEYPRCPETDVSTFCAPCTGHVDCCDANVCTFNRCTAGECGFEAVKYGNVNGDPNNLVNLDDILCWVSCFSNFASCPNADLHPPCTGNGVCNLDDYNALMAAYSGADPCGCVVP